MRRLLTATVLACLLAALPLGAAPSTSGSAAFAQQFNSFFYRNLPEGNAPPATTVQGNLYVTSTYGLDATTQSANAELKLWYLVVNVCSPVCVTTSFGATFLPATAFVADPLGNSIRLRLTNFADVNNIPHNVDLTFSRPGFTNVGYSLPNAWYDAGTQSASVGVPYMAYYRGNYDITGTFDATVLPPRIANCTGYCNFSMDSFQEPLSFAIGAGL